MSILYNNCCVCLSKECTIEINECDTNNVSIISKLQSIVSEVEWRDDFRICLQCLGRITQVIQFKNLCVQTYLIRLRQEKKYVAVERKLSTEVMENNIASISNNAISTHSTVNPEFLQIHSDKTLYNTALREFLDIHIAEEGAQLDLRPNIEVKEQLLDDASQTSHIDPESEGISCEFCFIKVKNHEEYSEHVKINHCDSGSSSADAKKSEETPKNTTVLKVKRIYSCEVCGVIFPLVKNVIEHCKIEHNMTESNKQIIRPYSCPHCPARFARAGGLNTHVKNHFEPPSHTCRICGKNYRSRKNLVMHEEAHLNQRSYKCDSCGKGYNTKENLRVHVHRMHTDPSEWKFHCDICDKRFLKRGSFYIHMKRHKGIKNFICHICQKPFVDIGDLRRHIVKSHTTPSNKQTHKCEECNKDFKDRNGLDYHIRRKHSILPQSPPPVVTVEPPPLGGVRSPKNESLSCHMCPQSQFYDKNEFIHHLQRHGVYTQGFFYGGVS